MLCSKLDTGLTLSILRQADLSVIFCNIRSVFCVSRSDVRIIEFVAAVCVSLSMRDGVPYYYCYYIRLTAVFPGQPG